MLARVALAIAATGRPAVALRAEDLAELPNLGSAFNDLSLWRYCVARLEHAGLGLPQ